jgi:hypothetical protein
MKSLIKYLGIAALVLTIGCKPLPKPPEKDAILQTKDKEGIQKYLYSGQLLSLNNAAEYNNSKYSFLIGSDSKKTLITCVIDGNMNADAISTSVSELRTLKDYLSSQQKNLSNRVETVEIIGNYENDWFVCSRLKGNNYEIFFKVD